MSWRKLPSEVRLQVVDVLDRDGRKGLRLASKADAILVTPRLFGTIHLTPNSRSFARAREVASSPHLAQHVHSIVFHLGVLEEIHSGFPTFRDDILRIHSPIGSTDAILKDVIWKYNCFLEEIEGQQEFETQDEADELKSICQPLEFLESITTVLDEEDPFIPPKDFIGARTGMHSSCSAEGSHFSNLYNAVAEKNLTRCRGWAMSWRCLPRIICRDLNMTEKNNMNELALGLYNSEFLEMDIDDRTIALTALDTFLATSISPEYYNLNLDFDEIPFAAMSTELCSISEVVFKHHWPRLRKLALQGITATEDDICSFLDKHSISLSILHLDDVDILDMVLPESDDADNDIDDGSEETAATSRSTPGSVLSLFRRIAESLTLDSASISGNFTNRVSESWYVDTEFDNDDSLRRRIELWLSRKGPSPFPEHLLYAETREPAQMDRFFTVADLMERPEGLKGMAAKQYSDESWVWDLDLII